MNRNELDEIACKPPWDRRLPVLKTPGAAYTNLAVNCG